MGIRLRSGRLEASPFSYSVIVPSSWNSWKTWVCTSSRNTPQNNGFPVTTSYSTPYPFFRIDTSHHPVEANGSRFVANRHPQSHFAILQYTILPILQLLQEELVMSLSFFISCHISTTLPILHFPRVPDDSTVEMLRNSILLVILHLVYRILLLVLLLIRHNLVCLGIPFN